MRSLTANALRILERRYLRQDAEGKPMETPDEMFRRVAQNIASADALHGATPQQVRETEREFFSAMSDLEFLPNSPTLINAGRTLQQLAACFVLPIDDSIPGIFEAIKQAAQIHKSGGGTGFSFSRLRPKGDIVASSHGVASGPISFIRVFDAMTETISQGGVRRGANMAILRVDHPDILEFIRSKSDLSNLCNFNISVALTEDFMRRVERGEDYDLLNPHTGKAVRKVNAREVFDLIVRSAWETGEPGVVFLDRINRDNPTPELGEIEATNPCGEQPLLPYEACTLGSINLSLVVKDGRMDHEKLRRLARLGVHFLDNVLDMSRYPVNEIRTVTQSNRKIGLGVMGFADMLIEMGMPYNSDEAISLGRQVMSFIVEEALAESRELARRRGPFPNYAGSVFGKRGEAPRRNATLTTVAPTGTISIIAGCSGGIEPVYALCYVRSALKGEKLCDVNPAFEKVAKERGFHGDRLMAKIAQVGSAQGLSEVPEDVQRVFVTAYDIAPEWHVHMQAAFQAVIDNAVSKTINFPASATEDDVRKAFRLAYSCGCKGITVYRDRSRPQQVLSLGAKASPSKAADCPVRGPKSVFAHRPAGPAGLNADHAGLPMRKNIKPRAVPRDPDKCPECGNKMEAEVACRVCKFCGYYRCG